MNQRIKATDKVIMLEEKNMILINILRDIVENEASIYLRPQMSDEEIERVITNRANRRNEILYEVQDFLYREGKALPFSI